MKKKELEKYYKQIKKNLPCSFFMKITFMSEFKKNVHDFISERSVSSLEEIINNFGTAEEISYSFKNMDNSHIKTKARLYLILSISLFVLLILTTYILIEVIQSSGGYVVDIID